MEYIELVCSACGGKCICEAGFQERHGSICPLCGSSNTYWGRTFNEAEVTALFMSNYPDRIPLKTCFFPAFFLLFY